MFTSNSYLADPTIATAYYSEAMATTSQLFPLISLFRPRPEGAQSTQPYPQFHSASSTAITLHQRLPKPSSLIRWQHAQTPHTDCAAVFLVVARFVLIIDRERRFLGYVGGGSGGGFGGYYHGEEDGFASGVGGVGGDDFIDIA